MVFSDERDHMGEMCFVCLDNLNQRKQDAADPT